MPVTINLKELFAADVQTIFTDKINYNFNRMLEFGIGEIGERGITGPGGSAGPGGIPGPEGQRGNKWFVGTGNPTGQSFTGLIDGDFYLDSVTSSIWQYSDTSPATWTLVADISAVVINFLDSLGAPFVRGMGDASPLDDRYIVFQHRSNNLIEQTADSSLSNPSDNDILLLNNWNEYLNTTNINIVNFPADTNELFNALQFISVDHTLTQYGRYHIELGSVYNELTTSDNVLSSLIHNLKIRYWIDTANGPLGIFPTSNDNGIVKSSFSLTYPFAPSYVNGDINKNAIFEFVIPKYNADGVGTVQQNIRFIMGANEGLADIFSSVLMSMDGLIIDNLSTTTSLEFGMGIPSDSLSNLPTIFDSVPMAIIDGTGDVNALFINKEIIQTNGDIIHIHTTPAEFITEEVTGGWTLDVTDKQRIFSNGENIFMVQYESSLPTAAADEIGRLTIYDTASPADPNKIHEITRDSDNYGSGGTFSPKYDLHGHLIGGATSSDGPYAYNQIALSGVSDVTFAGKYGYLCRNASISSGVNDRFAHNFEVFEMDSNGNNLHMVASTPKTSTMIYARRVKINGQYAFVMSAEMTTPGLISENYLTSINLCEPIVDPVGDPIYTINPGSANLPTMAYVDSTGSSAIPEDYLDFDIYNGMAFIIYKNHIGPTSYELGISIVNIEDPDNMAAYGGLSPIAEWSVQTQQPGAIKIDSQHAYVVCGTNSGIISGGNFSILSISEVTGVNGVPPFQGPTVVSSMEFEQQLIDVEVSGDYAYVLARFPAGETTIIIIDITDKSNPLFIAYDSTGLTTCINPSSMTLRGKHIYVAAAGNLPGDNNQGIYVFDIGGIKSPNANIGNIAANEIKVSGKISAGRDLSVGASAAVGSNLTVHGDLCVGGTINVDQYSFGMVPIGAMMPWVGWLTTPGSAILPAGWLKCDGTVVDDETYPELYALLVDFGPIGTLPNMIDTGGTGTNLGRVIVEPDGNNFSAQGDLGGFPTHDLLTAELPTHVHSLSGSFDLLGSFTTGTESDNHTHVTRPDNLTYSDGFEGGNSYKIFSRTSGSSYDNEAEVALQNPTTGSSTHTHDIDFTAMVTPPTVTLSGDTGQQNPPTFPNDPMDIQQPWIAINYIIYAGEPQQ